MGANNVVCATRILPLITKLCLMLLLKLYRLWAGHGKCPLLFPEFPNRLCKQWDNSTISHPSLCAFPFIILSLNLFVQSNLSNNRCHKQNLLTCSSRSPWQHSGVPKSLLHLRTSITLPTTTQSINVQKLTTLLFMDDSLFQILQNFSLRHWHFTEMTASNTNWILFPGIQSTKELFSPG